MKTVRVQYYAMLREECGCREETVKTDAQTAGELFEEVAKKHRLRWPREKLKVAVNDEIVGWQTELSDHDTVALLPPVAGG